MKKEQSKLSIAISIITVILFFGCSKGTNSPRNTVDNDKLLYPDGHNPRTGGKPIKTGKTGGKNSVLSVDTLVGAKTTGMYISGSDTGWSYQDYDSTHYTSHRYHNPYRWSTPSGVMIGEAEIDQWALWPSPDGIPQRWYCVSIPVDCMTLVAVVDQGSHYYNDILNYRDSLYYP